MKQEQSLFFAASEGQSFRVQRSFINYALVVKGNKFKALRWRVRLDEDWPDSRTKEKFAKFFARVMMAGFNGDGSKKKPPEEIEFPLANTAFSGTGQDSGSHPAS